jgi:hypothetical protein
VHTDRDGERKHRERCRVEEPADREDAATGAPTPQPHSPPIFSSGPVVLRVRARAHAADGRPPRGHEWAAIAGAWQDVSVARWEVSIAEPAEAVTADREESPIIRDIVAVVDADDEAGAIEAAWQEWDRKYAGDRPEVVMKPVVRLLEG